jgi:hypothetical protein
LEEVWDHLISVEFRHLIEVAKVVVEHSLDCQGIFETVLGVDEVLPLVVLVDHSQQNLVD